MSVASEIRTLMKSNPRLTAKAGVRWAKAHRQSALYRAMKNAGCWDQRRAAQLWAEHTFRRFVQIYVVDKSGAREAVSLVVDRTNGGGYREREEVLRAPDLRQMWINDALDELERVKRKYDQITALASVWSAINTASAQYGSARSRSSGQSPGSTTQPPQQAA